MHQFSQNVKDKFSLNKAYKIYIKTIKTIF